MENAAEARGGGGGNSEGARLGRGGGGSEGASSSGKSSGSLLEREDPVAVYPFQPRGWEALAWAARPGAQHGEAGRNRTESTDRTDGTDRTGGTSSGKGAEPRAVGGCEGGGECEGAGAEAHVGEGGGCGGEGGSGHSAASAEGEGTSDCAGSRGGEARSHQRSGTDQGGDGVHASFGKNESPAWEGVLDASEEVLLMWALRDPFAHRGGQLASQDAQECHVEVAGQRLAIQQDPGMLRLPGVTGSVLWDSGCALARVLELCSQNGWLNLRGTPPEYTHCDRQSHPYSDNNHAYSDTVPGANRNSGHSDSYSGSSSHEKGGGSPKGPRAESARGWRCCELGAGCGLLGCAALLLGSTHLTSTDQYDRLRLLAANLARNLPPVYCWLPDRRGRFHHQPGMDSASGTVAGSATGRPGSGSGKHRGRVGGSGAGKGGGVCPSVRRERGGEERSVCVEELMWGEPLEGGVEALGGPFDLVLASDVIYSEEQVDPLLTSLRALCGPHTLVLLAGELRNDAVIELFLERTLGDFLVCRAPHPFPGPHLGPTESVSAPRVAVYCLKKA